MTHIVKTRPGFFQLQPFAREEHLSEKVPFPSLRLNADTIIDLFPKKMWEHSARSGQERENMNHFRKAFSKESRQELVERLHDDAVPVEVGPVQRWDAHGTGTSVYFRNPKDNLIEARHYEEHSHPEESLLGS
jgi:hypothetical protein